MSKWIVSARAPSNIALVKYMGKKDSALNIPENSSLSMTLNSLCSLAEITVTGRGSGSVNWVPERPLPVDKDIQPSQLLVPNLGDSGVGRILRHLERVKNSIPDIFSKFDISYDLERTKSLDLTLRTANTFPASSGIASSASSFAAMTLAMSAALASDPMQFDQAWEKHLPLRRALARISRQGSGSSCRSFEGPWVLWEEEDAAALNTPIMPPMAHFVILIKTDPKRVSSSEAHALVRTSPLWGGRVERVESRTRMMISAFGKNDIELLARIAWAEAWEMHSLFHTCAEPFSYWEPGTIDALHWFSTWVQKKSPPIVTLDAGPNVHVIVEKSARELWRERLKSYFKENVILEDEQGLGAILNCRFMEG